MKEASFHILRVGLAITFLWIGILIFRNPESWVGFIQPWAMGPLEVLPISIQDIVLGTAFFDVIIGFLLLVGYFTWLVALLASLHLMMVLLVSGINAITIRDIGLLSATLAIFINSFPGVKSLLRSLKINKTENL